MTKDLFDAQWAHNVAYERVLWHKLALKRYWHFTALPWFSHHEFSKITEDCVN
jgi:hypothetical protein